MVAPVLGAPPLRWFSPPSLEVGATPAAGQNFVRTVDDGHWWRLTSLFVRLVNDANAANRQVQLQYRDQEDNIYYISTPPVTWPASETHDHSFSAWTGQADWTSTLPTVVPLAPLLLQPGHDFAIVVSNIQATDALSRIRFVVEKFYAPSSADYPAF